MTWTEPPRSAPAQAIRDAAEEDRRANPRPYSLDPDVVLERMVERGADPDRFAPGWREGFEQLCGSLAEDGHLTALGARMQAGTIGGKLVAGPKVDDALAKDHARANRPLLPPIVIVGGWRTGTTFLFRLLGTDPRLRAPLPMDLARPWKIAGMSAEDREAMLAAIEVAPNPMQELNPTLRSVHDYGPRLPEECVVAMGVDLRSWGLPSTVRLDSYARWMETQDLHTCYAEYRKVLQLLDEGDGRRWVLKAPAHTAELRTLVDTFPGAVVVHLHRDIVETVASGASLFAVFRTTYSDEVDPVDVGRFQTEQTELWFRRAAAYRADPHSKGATFVDLAYSELVASPVAAITHIYEAAGMAPPDDPAAFVDAYHQASPRHEHGQHRYAPEDFGLDRGELRERFAFLDGWPT